MSKQILVPLDGSDLSEAVLPQAKALAEAMSAKLMLVRVAPPMVTASVVMGAAPATAEVWEAFEREPEIADEYLELVADRLRSEGAAVDTTVLRGEIARQIVRYAETHSDVKLIAMATHARAGISRWVVGSVAEAVLHNSPVPLLLVHPQGDSGWSTGASPIRKILVPLDGSPHSEHALEHAKRLVADTGASLILLTVLTTEYDIILEVGGRDPKPEMAPWEEEASWAVNYLNETAWRLRLERVTIETRTAFGDPAEEILKAVSVEGADMVVMATHGRSGIARLLMGSVAMRVVQRSAKPVVLARLKDRVREREASHVKQEAAAQTP